MAAVARFGEIAKRFLWFSFTRSSAIIIDKRKIVRCVDMPQFCSSLEKAYPLLAINECAIAQKKRFAKLKNYSDIPGWRIVC